MRRESGGDRPGDRVCSPTLLSRTSPPGAGEGASRRWTPSICLFHQKRAGGADRNKHLLKTELLISPGFQRLLHHDEQTSRGGQLSWLDEDGRSGKEVGPSEDEEGFGFTCA